MRRGLKWMVVGALAMVNGACLLHGLPYVPGLDSAAGAGVKKMIDNEPERQAQAQKCDELKAVQPPLAEERSFGGALAMRLAARGNGLWFNLDKKVTTEALRDPNRAPYPSTGVNALTEYVNRVGKNLAAQSTRPTLAWTFGVIDSDAVNAFSAPGGYVFVTRGLLAKVENEAQLAGVLAHEITHITEGHAVRVYQATKSTRCRAAVISSAVDDATSGVRSLASNYVRMISAGAVAIDLDSPENLELLNDLVQGTLDGIVARGFDATDEYGADQGALALVAQAGYRPRELISFLGKLPKAETAFPHHPATADRQARLTTQLEDLGKASSFSPVTNLDTYPTVPNAAELAIVHQRADR